MSRRSAADRALEESVAQFCEFTAATPKEARNYLTKYKKLDSALNAFYTDPNMFGRRDTGPSTSKLGVLFDQYKEEDGDDIGIDGTIRFCQDLGVDPEDVVLLAIAYELKSPRMGTWEKKGWIDGWKAIGTDNIAGMKTSLLRLRDKLGSDPAYFAKVYGHTFDFARAEGQRSLAIETAIAFWQLLLPTGLQGGALAHIRSRDSDNDQDMDGEEGWKPEYNDWWFEFLTQRGGKGVSKDTWTMFLEFVRTIDSKFEKYDMEAAWPSTIDDFVEFAKEKLASGGA
ncbi:defective in Cullin neddylation protein 1 [Punctularia strigosozonata HHB-11173 SS5]|uniref:Defective in cullin neddylation protein n=1 Tax=Punctularia strigosozonata (strain HHB-11173) TaxID=741275 RepID=R7S5W6_PUNST|nr:defective in Cullin neddylation protein 1 [Punctularia strigosozonata HHB-11173 SS5]EIN05181.1 defective in Cullin neddylation protein 1 [Punctularia strigosozonata HHB-11173 SS5]